MDRGSLSARLLISTTSYHASAYPPLFRPRNIPPLGASTLHPIGVSLFNEEHITGQSGRVYLDKSFVVLKTSERGFETPEKGD